MSASAGPRYVGDVDALKALAHPLRQRMLTRLQSRGPATSAILAVEFDIDRGAASYHLRQLERFGFVEQDDAMSSGRRRFWRSVPADTRLPLSGEAAAGDEVQVIRRLWRDQADRELAAFRADEAAHGEFADAAMSSQGRSTLTAAELAAFAEEYIALLRRWRREPHEASPGARPVTVLFYAFPTPDQVGLG